jgi:YfiH family protein
VSPEREVTLQGLRVFSQIDWTQRFPGLVQGITARTADLDFGTPGTTGSSGVDGWERLRTATGLPSIARCCQVHGNAVVPLRHPLPEGVSVVADADALVSGRGDLLIAVTVADCVPVFFVDPVRRAIGLAHAGWRGIAAGVVEGTLAELVAHGSRPGDLRVHLGPAICGKCYEVGPDVVQALGAAETQRRTVDLRAHIAGALVSAGVDSQLLTASTACTRCDSGDFFSYRGGDRGQRMCAFLGWPPG